MVGVLKDEGLSAKLYGRGKITSNHLANLDQEAKNSLTFWLCTKVTGNS